MTDDHSLPHPTWVNTPARFRAMVDRLQGEPALALDTESNSLYAYHEQVCLLQISVPGADFLVDPLALRDLAALGPLLADPHVLKALHGAEYDLAMLRRDFGFTVANLFDTMWASRILGWPEHGLAALLQAHFGVTLNKKYQRADWGIRPLPPEQLDYARLDSHYLLPLQAIQAEALDEARRWPQARHRFELLQQVRWESKPFDPDGFWKVPGVRELDDPGRGILRALYRARDTWAEAEDLPPFKLLSNQAMLALSERRPHNLDALRRIRGLGRRCLGPYSGPLLDAIREGSAQPLRWDQRPRGNSGGGRPSPESQARFEALRAWRNARAEARGVEPDLILNNQTLWAVASRNPRAMADLGRGGLLAAWQVDDFGEELLAVVNGVPSR